MSNLPDTYHRLRLRVAEILTAGRVRAARAIEREKVTTYWAVGKTIADHLLLLGNQSTYGEQVIRRLARDVEIAERRLYEMISFHKHFPDLRAPANIGWGHFVQLLPLKSPDERDYYLVEAERHGWSTRQLKSHIHEGAYQKTLTPQPAERSAADPLRGRLNTFGVYDLDDDGLDLDLGFGITRRFPAAAVDNWRTVGRNHILESVPASGLPGGYGLSPLEGDPRFRYTYKAGVIRIVDGDTLRVSVDLGFNCAIRHTIRLRGVDTPEMKTPEGQEAKAFVARALADVSFVVIRTYWRGRYGRYLADVFYQAKQNQPQTVVDSGGYLNGDLVAGGLAEPV